MLLFGLANIREKSCEENRIDRIEKFGQAWMIPKGTEKPVDGQIKNNRNNTSRKENG